MTKDLDISPPPRTQRQNNKIRNEMDEDISR
ncbi:MAG: hypothetical protein ACI90V_012597 [Bacillariaceae sp.]|jgi:hypothetical protein